MAEQQQKPKDVNVIVAMDASEHAEYALHWYMTNIYKPHHHVILLHCPEYHNFIVGPLGGTASADSIALMIKDEETKERELLEKLGQKLKNEGIGGKVKSVAGKPGENICRVAEEENALMIVTGCRGMGTIRRTFMGSISDYVIHHSHVPVLVVRHKDSHKDIVHSH